MDLKINEKIYVIYEGGDYEGKHLARIDSFPTKSSATVEWLTDGVHKGTLTTVRKKYIQKIHGGKRKRIDTAGVISDSKSKPTSTFRSVSVSTVNEEVKALRERVEGLEYFLEDVIGTINERVKLLEKKTNTNASNAEFVTELAKYTNENFKKIHKIFKKHR